MQINKTPVWPGWEITELIGRGSYGTVYKIKKTDFTGTEYAALKVITVPQSEDDLYLMRHSGMDHDTITHTLQKQVGDILNEYKLMKQLRDIPGIVHCDRYEYQPHTDGIGWDIYIQMELLTPFLRQETIIQDEASIVAFGRDLCEALVACQSLDIIHRDIKPQNIFITESGHYKLGDFGIARTAERTSTATARAGTVSFMAPEVYSGERYNQTVDIYSLGMVLYWLLNEQKPPFVLEGFTMEDSHYKRFHGEPLPPPKNGSEALKKIVLKACSFDPKERYPSASAMLSALSSLSVVPSRGFIGHNDNTQAEIDETYRVVPAMPTNSNRKRIVTPAPKPGKQIPPPVEQQPPESTHDPNANQPTPTKNAPGKRSIFAVISACVALLAMVLTLSFCSRTPDEPNNPTILAIPGSVEFNGRYYRIFDTPLATYEEAVAFCRDLGGHMADINSEDENQFLYEYLCAQGYDHIFLGGSDAEEDGIWKWDSGESFDYQNWNEGEPNNDLGGEDHLAMYQVLSDGSWNDITFTAPAFQDGIAKVSKVEASSYCVDPQKNCSADHLIDSDPATVWCTSEADTGIGESVMFKFENRKRLTGFTIYSGNQSGVLSFDINRRPITIRLVFDDESFRTFEIEDHSAEQTISFDNVIVTASVKMVIESASGPDETSIAISGIDFHTEDRKTGFLCEWENADSAAAATASAETIPPLRIPPETIFPSEPPETILVQTEFTEWTDILPEYVTSTDYIIEEQTLYSTQKLEKTTSTERDKLEGWTLVDTISNLGEYGPWSDWSSQKISGSDTRNVDIQTRYRYKTKDTTTSGNSDKDGWELYDTTYTWGDYGNWSDWSTTSISGSDTRQVETKTQYSYRDKWVAQEYSDWSGWSNWSWTRESTSDLKKEESKNFYGYYYFQCRSCGAHMPYSTPCETWGGGCGATNNNYWNEIWSATSWDNAGLYKWHGTRKLATYEINGSLTFKWDNGDGGPKLKYRYATRTLENVTNYGSWSDYSDTVYSSNSTREVRTRTIYRYRDREQVPTYHFYRWGEWSDWSTKSISENSDRIVETKKYYRYQDKVTEMTYCFERWSDWTAFTTEAASESAEQKVQTKKQYRYRSKTADEKRNPYTDVSEKESWFDAVMWVTELGIMNGTAVDAFGPNGTVTRGQMMMMLWRAAGKPVPSASECSFQDVPTDSPYRNAVLWAIENGITGGESADKFGMDSVCSRGQAITFLYRAAGEPEVALSQEPFDDVESGTFYYRAVLWAYENNISSGLSTTEFGISANCTRMQTAVMLYRAFSKT